VFVFVVCFAVNRYLKPLLQTTRQCLRHDSLAIFLAKAQRTQRTPREEEEEIVVCWIIIPPIVIIEKRNHEILSGLLLNFELRL